MSNGPWAWALAVDDNPEVLRVVGVTLARVGIHTTTAASGEAGLAALAQRTFDLVLLDNDMPGMRGLDVLAHIKGSPEFRHVPVLSITGNASPTIQAEFQRLGVAGFLPKPFEMLDLLQATLTTLKRPPAKETTLAALMEEYASARIAPPEK